MGYSTGLLEERLKVRPGDETWGITEATLEELFALHRLRGEERVLQLHAAFHDLRYYYMATVSGLAYSFVLFLFCFVIREWWLMDR